MGYSGEVGVALVKKYKLRIEGTEKEWLQNLDTFIMQMQQDVAFEKDFITNQDAIWGIQIAIVMRQKHLENGGEKK